MNGELSILIYHVPSRKTIIVSDYIDNFLITSKDLNIIDILKEMPSQNYKVEDIRGVKIVIV